MIACPLRGRQEKLTMTQKLKFTAGALLCGLAATVLFADDNGGSQNACKDLPSQASLRSALISARQQNNGGFNGLPGGFQPPAGGFPQGGGPQIVTNP